MNRNGYYICGEPLKQMNGDKMNKKTNNNNYNIYLKLKIRQINKAVTYLKGTQI